MDDTVDHAFFLQKVWPWIDAAMYSFIPLTTIFILNALIIRELHKAGQTRKIMSQQLQQPKKDNQERQITRMLLLVSFAFLILTSPIAVLILVEKVWHYSVDPVQDAVMALLRNITFGLELLNHAINFWLYCAGASRYRRQLAELICWWRWTADASSSNNSISSTGARQSISSVAFVSLSSALNHCQ